MPPAAKFGRGKADQIIYVLLTKNPWKPGENLA